MAERREGEYHISAVLAHQDADSHGSILVDVSTLNRLLTSLILTWEIQPRTTSPATPTARFDRIFHWLKEDDDWL